MSLSICRCFHPLVVLPNILPSIMSCSSESCLKICPIHLSLRCCTVSKMFCFLGLSASVALHQSLPCQPSSSSPLFSRSTFRKLILIVFLYQLVSLSTSQHNKEQCSTLYILLLFSSVVYPIFRVASIFSSQMLALP